MLTSNEFYRDTNVIRRMLEYCGVPPEISSQLEIRDGMLADSASLREISKHMTAEWLSGWGEHFMRTKGKKCSSRYPEQIGELLDGGLNISRSSWDKQNVTFFLDVEYLSHRYPGECYVNPDQVFQKLEPVYRCIWDVLNEHGIRPITSVTGQGYHFVFNANSYDRDHKDPERKDTSAAKKLVDIGFLEETLKGKYMHLPWHTKRRRVVEPALGRAFDATGKLLEFVMHKVIRRLPSYGCNIPVGIGDLIPGNEKKEIVNLDLSTYIEPIFTRGFRSIFSIHDKHKYPDKESDSRVRQLPVAVAIPRFTPCNGNELSLAEVFRNRRHFRNAANYASAITTEIPDCSEGVLKLAEAYEESDLFQFHKDFDFTPQDDPAEWRLGYDNFPMSSVPPCVARAIAEPNPFLLRPAHIHTLVRVLTGKNWWHPAHVAGLIRSKYERDHNWDYNWGKYDANRHARGWVRFYSGLLAAGLDERTDQNCISHQEKGMCVKPFCGYDIGKYK